MPSYDRNLRIGIIGGGVVGLSTALALKNEFSSVLVDVISDRDYSATTSYGPPGIFRPRKNYGVEKEWAAVSYERYMSLWASIEASVCGVQSISGYFLAEEDAFDWCKAQVLGLERHVVWLDADELKYTFPAKYKHGFHCTTLITEGRYYGQYLINKLESANVSFQRKHVDSINEYDVIINCTGLGAEKLVNDTRMQPQKGVLIQVNAPWLKNYIFTDHSMTYIIPGLHSVHLGCIKELGNYSLEISGEDRNDIMQRTADLIPALKNCSIVKEWSGLRPWRDEVRVEADNTNTFQVPVIHNYGHGGNGFVLSWGCAQNVVQLVKNTLNVQSKL